MPETEGAATTGGADRRRATERPSVESGSSVRSLALAAKPSAKLFEHALRDLGITNKSRVLMVGDDLLADIKGGLNAGVDTCWFNPGNLENKSGITPKYTVSSYEELYRIVMEPEELENIGVRNRRHSNEALL